MDSGGGQPLLMENSSKENLMLNIRSATTNKQEEPHKADYYTEWQKELKARKVLEQTIYSLQ